jgi:hypothetical protein
MNPLTRRLVSNAIQQVAGHGVGLDPDGRLCFPDGLDPERVHRFIELVMDESHESPKAALKALFERVGVPRAAIDALDEVLTEEAALEMRSIGRKAFSLGAALPSVREIPVHFRRFLIDGLGFASEADANLEEAVVSTRKGAAASLGCAPHWDAILEHADELPELGRAWRESTASKRR